MRNVTHRFLLNVRLLPTNNGFMPAAQFASWAVSSERRSAVRYLNVASSGSAERGEEKAGKTTKYGDPLWWIRDSELKATSEGLVLQGKDVGAIARSTGTPVYIYSAKTVRSRLAELRDALTMTGAPFRIHYAIKANRFKPLLQVIRGEGDIGIDTSSPREADLALSCGFAKDEVSVTVSMASNRDLQHFADYGLHVNLDTKSMLRRWAAIPHANRNVGIRVDPAVALGYGSNPKLSYGGSKFGVLADELPHAVELAQSLGLVVDTIHFHPGWGLQQSVLPQYEATLKKIAHLAAAIPTVHTVNVGGGLSWRHQEDENPLLSHQWAALLKKYIQPLGVKIACEVGTYVMASAGILVAEVNTVERRKDTMWLGIDAGHNVNVYAAHYSIPQQIIHVNRPLDASDVRYTIAGNINEANDIFSSAAPLPATHEGDLVAFFPAGAYGSSMASDHCMKGLPAEYCIDE